QEEELAINFDEAMNAKDYEQALTIISKLIDIRNDYHVSYLWLGDCHRGLGQVDQALESYRKALDLEGKYYIVGDDFKDTVSLRIRVAEIEQKATLAYREGHYEEAIEYIDEFLMLNPKESKAHILRGLCNEARDDYNRAIRDYKAAFNNGLPDDMRELLNRRLVFLSNPITILDKSKYLKLLVDDMPTKSELGEQIDKTYYMGFRNIFDGNRKLHEAILKSVDPKLEAWRSAIIKQRNTVKRTGYNVELMGFDEDGYFLVNDIELVKE
ncbi:unnamed protein product, partial [marine sediment metagenome]